MSYSYLLDLYQILKDRKIELSEQRLSKSSSEETLRHQQGQLDTIADFESYLREKFHSRLPRRLQKLEP